MIMLKFLLEKDERSWEDVRKMLAQEISSGCTFIVLGRKQKDEAVHATWRTPALQSSQRTPARISTVS